jgi:hypothetical protein
MSEFCFLLDEIADRWKEHYHSVLNHPSAAPCQNLDDFASAASPDTAISEDAPTLLEVTRAIQRLKNGKAAGSDGITPDSGTIEVRFGTNKRGSP